jgi:NTP pyrophosphatase (non-canonical NTP hydrolase)
MTDYKALCLELHSCLKWYIQEDDTIEGEDWDKENEYWIEGKHKAIRITEKVEKILYGKYSDLVPQQLTHQQEAEQFRMVMNLPCGNIGTDTFVLQNTLIREEQKEVEHAVVDLVETGLDNTALKESLLKELADLCYVCYQLAAAAGWDLDAALTLVHQSNMSKLVDGKPVYREDGKVLKGCNYLPPDLEYLV